MKVYPFLILDECSDRRGSFLGQGHLFARYEGELSLLGMPRPWRQGLRRAFIDWLKVDSDRFVDSFRDVDLTGVDSWVVCDLDDFYRVYGYNRSRYVSQVSCMTRLLKDVKEVPVVAYFSHGATCASFLYDVVDEVRFYGDEVWDRLFAHPKSHALLEDLVRRSLDTVGSL